MSLGGYFQSINRKQNNTQWFWIFKEDVNEQGTFKKRATTTIRAEKPESQNKEKRKKIICSPYR